MEDRFLTRKEQAVLNGALRRSLRIIPPIAERYLDDLEEADDPADCNRS